MPAVLNSWKEIAVFLNRGVRTTQRWERSHGLPVHRVGTGRKAPVIAFAAELQDWLRATPVVAGGVTVRRTTRRVALDRAAIARQRKLRMEMQSLLRTQHDKLAAMFQHLHHPRFPAQA